MKKKYKEYLERLKNKEIYYYDIPECDRLDFDFIAECSRSNINTFCNRGFDVIENSFFVEIYDKSKGFTRKTFDSFDSFFDFLNGDIYPCSCYYQYDFSPSEIEQFGIDFSRINYLALTSLRKKDYTPKLAYEKYAEKEKKAAREQQKEEKAERKRQSIMDKYEGTVLSSSSYEALYNTLESFKKEYEKAFKGQSAYLSILEHLRKYMEIQKDYTFQIVMKYVSENLYFPDTLISDLFFFYDPDLVLEAYKPTSGSKSTNAKYRVKMREYVKAYKNNPGRFERKTNEENIVVTADAGETISKAADEEESIAFYSGYDWEKREFWVRYEGICNQRTFNGSILFHYFFDFIVFFDGNLSGADLLFCDGLSNLKNWDNIDFSNARLTSKMMDKFGLIYSDQMMATPSIDSFSLVLQNERETIATLMEQRQSDEDRNSSQRIYYVSDLHLDYQISNSNYKTNNDIIYFITKVIRQIGWDLEGHNPEDCLLIGGDIASDFTIYSLFIKELRREIKYMSIFVVLGNHELWAFPNNTYEEIVAQYRTFLSNYNISLLENDMICDYGNREEPRFVWFSEEDILSLQPSELRSEAIKTRMILFGGLGFAGLNSEFNASNGLYQSVVNRKQEIQESERIDNLYAKISNVLFDKPVVICTHNPLKDWSKASNPLEGFYYVSGHTHRNDYYDDSIFHVYSDNQIGYFSRPIHLKYFSVDGAFDLFSEYSDGIYEITREQYVAFNYGKYIRINFSREYRKLFMLKKNRYYMFIMEALSGNLQLLNGGAIKKLERCDVNYYYDKMDSVIQFLKKPTEQFSMILNKVSQAVKQIGGSGKIHGCIVDIDFYNHIYVNHLDLSLTGYWALDMINKEAYASIPALLKQNCPQIFECYLKLIGDRQQDAIAVLRSDIVDLDLPPVYYPSTDIYSSSRYVKKLQRLNSNILAEWREPDELASEHNNHFISS